MRFLFLLSSLLLLFSAGSPSPANAQSRPVAGGSVLVGLPQGAFARHMSAPAFGIGGYVGQKLPGLPLVLGIDGATLVYGLDTRSRPYEVALGERVSAFTTHSIAMGHFLVRLQDENQPISPYADVLVGAKYFFTATRVDGARWHYNGDPLGSTPAFDDFAFSYGMGGGVRVEWLPSGIFGRFPAGIELHAGLRYLFGPRASYLQRGGVSTEDGDIVYSTTRSRTDMVVPHFGLTIFLIGD